MSDFYSEWEPFAAQWLQNLVDGGQLPHGAVSDADIRTVNDDLSGYGQCHFFAGIGGWPLALKQADWPRDIVTWTGSCPCQPFSAAGRRGGTADERHLWPDWFELIARYRPAVVFGEQVASTEALAWWDSVSADLEGAGYTCAAFDLCAASVGAPHVRQRLYWVAYSYGERRDWERVHVPGRKQRSAVPEAPWGREARGAGDASGAIDWLPCGDGKARPTQPGLQPLAARVPGDVGKIRAYGNAICVPLAVEFVKAVMETVL